MAIANGFYFKFLFFFCMAAMIAMDRAVTVAAQEHDEQFERTQEMQTGCKRIQWTVDIEKQKARFKVISQAGADWVGVGLSENGGMKGADISII